MNKEWATYGQTEYVLKVSLRSRFRRDIVVFRIDAHFGTNEPHILFLDRAATPVSSKILREWAQVLDDTLATAIEHRYGLQDELPLNELELLQKGDDH